jgi:SP family myo-inositol transporter-like MFS transporter 13
MISIDMIFLGTGSVLAYAMDAAFQHVAHGWRYVSSHLHLNLVPADSTGRYMVGIGAVPSILLGVFLFWCPESPRQLMYHNKRDACFKVLRQVYPNATETQVNTKLLSIEYGVSQAKALEEEMTVTKSLKTLFFIPANLRACIAACGLM